MKKPNIILINCDDMGYGDLGCYGSKLHDTPNIDKMAAEGILCTDFYAGAPVCSPSRAGLMTGCYPARVGFTAFYHPNHPENDLVLLPGHGQGLDPKEISMASMLKNVGYATGLVGKWHCGDQQDFLPTNHGFDMYYGIPYSNDMGRQKSKEEEKNTEIDIINNSVPLPLLLNDEVIEQQPNQVSLTERYVEQSIRFIRENKENPFFLYFAHMHPHLPLYAPENFYEHSKNGRYGACIEEIDWSVGALLQELKRLNLEKDTLIVFTSDNGSNASFGPSNGELRGRKGTTWEGGLRVPGIFYWPGTIPSGQRYEDIISQIDLYAGFAALAEAEMPADRIIDSIDISPLLRGDISGQYRETFFYYRKHDLEAVRCGDWKLHVSKAGEPVHELYNLRQDLGETTDVISEHPEIVQKLEELLDECRSDLGDAVKGMEGEGVRSLGYVDNPIPLTRYDQNHPYIVACYDSSDRG